jgi:hypothetical protein
MISAQDVEHLVIAYEEANRALERKAPRKAAKILCEEFNWLIKGHGSFFADVRDATLKLEEHQKQEEKVFRNIVALLDKEQQIFAELGIDPARTGPIVGDVYGALKLNEDLGKGPTSDGLKVLHESLAKATELICRETKGPIRRGFDWVFSRKGATVLGGAAVVGGNIAIMVAAHHAPVSWVSVKAGLKVMSGDIAGILELFGHG